MTLKSSDVKTLPTVTFESPVIAPVDNHSSDHNYSILDNDVLSNILISSVVEDLNTPVFESKLFPYDKVSVPDTVMTTEVIERKQEDSCGDLTQLECDWNTSLLGPLHGEEESVPIVPSLQPHHDVMLESFDDKLNIDNSNWCELDSLNSIRLLEANKESVQLVPGAESSPELTQDTVFDYNLASVALETLTGGDLSPIIKVGLKSAILAKRQKNGLEEPSIDLKPEEPDEITPDIEEKRNERRQRNKLAARKCRSKKKERCDCLKEEIVALESKNETLTVDIKKLREEHEHLLLMYTTHLGTSLCTQTCS